jgi:hypothetical protein
LAIDVLIVVVVIGTRESHSSWWCWLSLEARIWICHMCCSDWRWILYTSPAGWRGIYRRFFKYKSGFYVC